MSGHGLELPGLDVDRLLDALSVVETSRGKNNFCRFEKSWAPVGVRLTIQGRIVMGTGRLSPVALARWQKWGPASACSYSSWQILYHTAADRGYNGHPAGLWDDAVALPWVLRQLAWLAMRGCSTVRHFADAWNSGSARDSVIPEAYIAKVMDAYHG